RLDREPRAKHGRWLLRNLDRLLDGIYLTDLLQEKILSRSDLTHPSEEILKRLRHEAESARDQHRLYPRTAFHKASSNGSRTHWETAAQSALFRSKRCEALAKLLSIRAVLTAEGLSTGSRGELRRVLRSSAARNAIGQTVRLVKAQRVGIDMMDITVCGAISPYNHLL